MGTWIVGAVVLAVVGLAVRVIYTNSKKGKGGGCDGCSGCPKSEHKK